MWFRFSSDVRNLFSETWLSLGKQSSGDTIQKYKHPSVYGLGYSLGWVYAYFVSRRVARDMNFVSSVKRFVEKANSGRSEEELSRNRSATRFCSTQPVGKLMFLFPRDFAVGVRDSLSSNIGHFFPQKGDRPTLGLGFNYYVSEVVFEYFENYGGLYYNKSMTVDVVFDVELASSGANLTFESRLT